MLVHASVMKKKRLHLLISAHIGFKTDTNGCQYSIVLAACTREALDTDEYARTAGGIGTINEHGLWIYLCKKIK